MSDDPSTLGYAEALAELDAILADLDNDRVDIDSLGETVERASYLIEACRLRLDTARATVEEIVAGLDDGESAAEAPNEDLAPETPESPAPTDE